MTTELLDKAAETRLSNPREEKYLRPAYRSTPTDDGYDLQVFLPGVPKGGAEVALDGDELTIIGRRRNSVPESWNSIFQELSNDDYRLRLRLNIRVNEECVNAHVEDGILHLTLPLHEAARPRLIAVS